MFDIIQALAASGAGVVISSAEYEDLAHLCTRVLIFRSGRVAAELSGSDLTKESIIAHCMMSDGASTRAQTHNPQRVVLARMNPTDSVRNGEAAVRQPRAGETRCPTKMRALQRVIGILEAVAELDDPVTASAVADHLELSLSTTARLMRELADEELLERTGSGYTIGTRLLGIVQSARQPHTLAELALPPMQGLRDETGETVSLHVRQFDQRVCIAAAESPQAVRRVVPVGYSVALHTGATGEVLLSNLSDADLDNYLTGLHLSAKARRETRNRVEAARNQGWALGVDRWTKGLSGIVAPVFRQSEVVAAISASGPSERWTRAVMTRHLPALLAAASTISQRVGPMTRTSG